MDAMAPTKQRAFTSRSVVLSNMLVYRPIEAPVARMLSQGGAVEADQFTGHGVVVHASARFPVVRAVCGGRGPAAGRWLFVDCLDCLRIGAVRSKDPRVRQRLDALEQAGNDAMTTREFVPAHVDRSRLPDTERSIPVPTLARGV